MWNPRLYYKFKAMHFASFEPVLKLVDKKPNLRVVDLGCGTGELTRKLADSLQNSDVLGVDTSPEMLQESRTFVRKQLRYEVRSIEDIVAEKKKKWDLVFSRSALHWVGDHRAFFPKHIECIAQGGQLAAEMAMPNAYFFKLDMDELAGKEPYRTAMLSCAMPDPLLSSEEYASILFQNGGTNISAFEKVFPEVLQDADAIFDFMEGTMMSATVQRLPQHLQQPFKDEYRKLLRDKYPQTPVFFPYKKAFVAATF